MRRAGTRSSGGNSPERNCAQPPSRGPLSRLPPRRGTLRPLRALLRAGAVLLIACGPRLAAEELRIGTVTIRVLDVFSPEEAARGWVYRAANALHFKTLESAVRRFLLFHEGDPFDPDLLAQTERNLRALPFVKLAQVTASAPHDGLVDVTVVTQDPWTLEPGVAYGSKGGVTTYGVEIQEKDLLGTGRGLTAKWDKGTERTTRTLRLNDPAFFAAYVAAELALSDSSDGTETRLQLTRPFFSFRERWSGALLLDDLTQHEKIYASGDMIAEFRDKHREALFTYGRALLATDEHARRLSAGIDFVDDLFDRLEGRPDDQLPEDRRYRDLTIGFEDVWNDFVKLDYVNRDLRVEDFNLGAQVTATVGFSPALFGASRNTLALNATLSHGRRFGKEGFLLATLSARTRLDGGLRSTLVSADLQAVRKLETRLRQTTVARLRVDWGWRLDRDVQLFADGLNGLRGYRLYAFEGSRRVVLNLEHRIFSGREILQLVAPGLAVFFDTGTALPEGQSIRLSDLESDAGVGLRFGIARAPSNNILRVDFAYAFDRDPFGRRGWLVSFSSAQAF